MQKLILLAMGAWSHFSAASVDSGHAGGANNSDVDGGSSHGNVEDDDLEIQLIASK